MVQPVRTLEPREGIAAHDAPQAPQQPPAEPARRTRGAGSAALGGLAPLARTATHAGASSARTGAAPQASRPEYDVDATASFSARLRDTQAVLALAEEFQALEAQLATLKAPRQPAADDAPQMSEAELQHTVRRLRTKHESAARHVAELSGQCEQAREVVEQLIASLEGKTRRLEQLEREHGAALQSDPQTAPRPSPAAAPREEGRSTDSRSIAALSRQIDLLAASRSAAADEASAVAERDGLRALAEVGALETIDFVSPELQEKVTAWLRNLPEVSRRAARRHGDPDRQFDMALKAAFEHIGASGTEPQRACRAFMHAVSSMANEGVGTAVERMLAIDLAASLRVATVGRRSGKSLDQMNAVRRRFNQAPAQVTAKRILAEFERTHDNLCAAQRQGATVTQVGDQVLSATELGRAVRQTAAMVTHLKQHQAAFHSMIDAMERYFVQSMEVDDIEKMGQQIAPQLGGYYSARVAELNAQRAALNQAPALPATRRAEQPAAAGLPRAASAGTDLDQLEVRIGRLRGEIQSYTEQHEKEFKSYRDLSERHITASSDLDEIAQDLAAQQQQIGALREAKHEDLRQRATRGDEAGHLEGELTKHWAQALRSPELRKLISRTALGRVVDVHLGQNAAKMRARTGRVQRTGTFLSRAGLLRVIADIARHELDKPASALLARTPHELDRIASGYPGDRVDALCNHGRVIGQGVRKSARGIEEARTGTSQYAIEWVRGEGARISHLHPWVSPY